MALEAEGHCVFSCADASDIYGHINRDHPDLIILDLFLPGTKGDAVCRDLKRAKTTRDIPLILTSANNNLEKIAISTKADAFLAKPFDLDHLYSLITTLTKT